MQKHDYYKYVTENIIKTYKPSSAKRVKNVNYKSKLLVEKSVIYDRFENIEEIEACINVKDHKEGFPHKFLFYLIKPSKSDIGKTIKNLLDKINNMWCVARFGTICTI